MCISLFGGVGQLELPPALVAALNPVVAPHQLDGVGLPRLQGGQLVCHDLLQPLRTLLAAGKTRALHQRLKALEAYDGCRTTT